MTKTADPFFSLGLHISLLEPRGKRKALYQQIKGAIVDGRLKPGLQLPASRSLAKHFGVSRNLVVAVYDLLLSEGYVLARQGSGSFVASPPARLADRSRRFDPRVAKRLTRTWRNAEPVSSASLSPLSFRLGVPDETLFPHDIWRRLFNRANRQTSRGGGGYGDPMGAAPLREAIAVHTSQTRAVGCNTDDIVVTNGAQQAFDLLARVLVEPGRTVVATEEPGYPAVRDVFSAMGAVVCPVRVDQEGLVVDEIPREAAVICVTPSHQFPLGVAMSPHRRLSLLARADASNAVIVEDDYDGEFRFHARPLDALQTLDRDSRVFYVGTFSKCMSPALRLGFVVCPPWARNALVRAKQLSDWNCSMASQEALAAFMTEGHLARHIRRMRGVYAGRRRALLAALRTYCSTHLEPFAAIAGLHIAARLQSTSDAEEIVRRASVAGIGIRSIAEFAAGKSTPCGFVFGYGAIAERAIAAGIQGLGGILRRVGAETRNDLAP